MKLGYAKDMKQADRLLKDIETHDLHSEDPKIKEHIKSMRGTLSP